MALGPVRFGLLLNMMFEAMWGNWEKGEGSSNENIVSRY